MNRLIILGLAATLGATYTVMLANPPVELQPASPGTAQTGHLNITGTATVGLLRSQGTVFGASTAPTGFAYGGFFTVASNQGRGFYGYASSPTGLTYGGFFQNASTVGRAVYGLATATSGSNYGGYFQTASTAGRAILGVAAAATGTTYGVYGKAVSPSGYGVFSEGNLTATGVISGNGAGLTSLSASNLESGTIDTARLPVPMVLTGDVIGGSILSVTNSSTLASYGIEVHGGVTAGVRSYGGSTGVSGSGNQKGGDFFASGPDGYGVIGFSNSPSGETCGVLGEVISTNGIAVLARSSGVTGANYALKAESSSPSGFAGHFRGMGADAVYVTNTGSGRGIQVNTVSDTAVWGNTAGGFAGVDARTGYASGYGLYARNDSLTGTNYGVAGQTSSGSFGVYSFGNMGASGTKPFRIDHPDDPENKYLLHYSTESPTPQNFYTGNVKTDAQGKAWVELPSYFAEINANFKYQLTVLDDTESQQFVQVKVGRKIVGNRFLIMSSVPNVEVSWRVEADRHDAWVRKYGAPTEVEKSEVERGTYQHPELYGLGPERAINYRQTHRAEKPKLPVEPSLKSK